VVKRNTVINAALVMGAVLVTLGLFEGVVFRFVLPAPDLPRLTFQNGVVKHVPNQHGTNRLRDEITTRWQVNANGWTSSIPEYRRTKTPGTYRIAVIGDSYVQGLSVQPTENVAEQLQQALHDPSIEVYRFGIAGAPMSQYLHMLRREVCAYHPDLVVINLVHNDFRESHVAATAAPGVAFNQPVHASSFLKLELNGRTVTEVEPHALVQPWYESLLADLATWRYLAHRYQLRYRLIRAPEPSIPADADRLIAEYVIPRLRLTATECGARLAVAIDGDREVIYSGRSEPSSRLRLNEIAIAVAQRQHVPFVDLHRVFRRDYLLHGQMFNFESDYHWNRRGHAVAAAAIKDLLIGTGLVPSSARVSSR